MQESVVIENDEDHLGLRLRTLVTPTHKITTYTGRRGAAPFGELLDLHNDPQELYNLWSRPAHATLRCALIERLHQRLVETDAVVPRRLSHAQTASRRARMTESLYARFRDTELTLRDYLATDRTVLANERTLLGYVRTGLAIVVVGVTAIELDLPSTLTVLGGVLVVVGVATLVVGVWRYRRFQQRLAAIGRK